MTTPVVAPPSRGVTPWATLLVAIIVAELIQVVGTVVQLFLLPGTVGYLSEEFDTSVEIATSITRMVMLSNVAYLVMAALILLVAIILLIRLNRSGRPVRWGMAVLVGCLLSIPVGAALFLAQSPIARAVGGIGS